MSEVKEVKGFPHIQYEAQNFTPEETNRRAEDFYQWLAESDVVAAGTQSDCRRQDHRAVTLGESESLLGWEDRKDLKMLRTSLGCWM